MGIPEISAMDRRMRSEVRGDVKEASRVGDRIRECEVRLGFAIGIGLTIYRRVYLVEAQIAFLSLKL